MPGRGSCNRPAEVEHGEEDPDQQNGSEEEGRTPESLAEASQATAQAEGQETPADKEVARSVSGSRGTRHQRPVLTPEQRQNLGARSTASNSCTVLRPRRRQCTQPLQPSLEQPLLFVPRVDPPDRFPDV